MSDNSQKSYYRFNFRNLEDRINESYVKLRQAEIDGDLETYKVGLAEIYQRIADAAYGVLSVNTPEYLAKNHIDLYEEACNYAIYAISRIESKRLNWDYTIRQAWIPYIRLNLRYVHDYPKTLGQFVPYDNLLDESNDFLSSLVSEYSQDFDRIYRETNDVQIFYTQTYSQVLSLLKLYCSGKSLPKMLPLIFLSLRYGIELPDHVESVKKLFLVLLKKLTSNYTNSGDFAPVDLPQLVSKNIIVLILLIYLSSKENSKLSLELTSSLDFLSIVRLSLIAGGKSIYIPTSDELDSIVAAAIAVGDSMSKGSDLRESRQVAKHAIGFKHDVRRLNKFIKSIVQSLKKSDLSYISQFGVNCEIPFFSTLGSRLESLDQCHSELLGNISKLSDSTRSPDELLKCLSELEMSEQRLISFIERLLVSRSE